MDCEFWQSKWQSHDIAFNQVKPNELLQRYFHQLSLKPGSRIFVPLCGKSIDMIWLLSQGHHVVGVELSLIACNAFFQENRISVKTMNVDHFTVFESPQVTLFAGDFFKLNQSLLGRVDAVYDRAALIALPNERRKIYVDHLMKLINPSTPIFLITTHYPQEDMQGPPFSVGEEELGMLFSGLFMKQIYNKSIKSLPDHLIQKGLKRAKEQVYWIR